MEQARDTESGEARVRVVLVLAVFRLCFHLALRIEEAIGAALGNLREDYGDEGLERVLHVVGKGGKIREVPIVGRVAEAMEAWLEVRETLKIRPGHERYIFISPRRGQRPTRKRQWERLVQYAQRAGWPSRYREYLSPHKLRHARAYLLINDGVPINRVQAVLGHASITTTQIYVEDDERARRAALRSSSE
jgi:site-specific recombinase XerD